MANQPNKPIKIVHLSLCREMELPLMIGVKYVINHQPNDEGLIVIRETIRMGNSSFRLPSKVIAELPEYDFKRIYSVPKNKIIFDYSKFYLNPRRLPPWFDIIK